MKSVLSLCLFRVSICKVTPGVLIFLHWQPQQTNLSFLLEFKPDLWHREYPHHTNREDETVPNVYLCNVYNGLLDKHFLKGKWAPVSVGGGYVC